MQCRADGMLSGLVQSTAPLREIRTHLGLSQAKCAAALGVAVETFRTWDASRRPTPEAVVERAKSLKVRQPAKKQLPVQVLAKEFDVDVRTLRAAARDGRLATTFSPRPFFGHITATATREAVMAFKAEWYRRAYGRGRLREIANATQVATEKLTEFDEVQLLEKSLSTLFAQMSGPRQDIKPKLGFGPTDPSLLFRSIRLLIDDGARKGSPTPGLRR